jgi:hypothetical protein
VHVVLHPRHKLQYFKNIGWEDDWIQTAEDLVRDEFARWYVDGSGNHYRGDENKENEMNAPVGFHKIFNFLLTPYMQATGNIFDNLPALTAPKAALRNEVDRYLSTDPEQTSDVLMWWNDRRTLFPCLSRMALNYLSIPGTSNNFVSDRR